MNTKKTKIHGLDYHDYVIKDGKFIGAFEEMYQNIEDPWSHGDATAVQYDLVLLLIKRNNICSNGGRILDIGCGKGAFTSRIKGMLDQCSVTGIDIAPTAIRHARNRYGSIGINFLALDIQQDYKKITGKFNLIIMSQILWYVLPSIREITDYLFSEVLSDDGCILINQAFYKPEKQSYGMDIMTSVEDLIRIVNMPPSEILEANRLTNHNAILLFRKMTPTGTAFNNTQSIP
jgi:SAM-dependent methyltransferase